MSSVSLKALSLALAGITGLAHGNFEKGPLISAFGPHAPVKHTHQFDPSSRFQVAFDAASQADVGKVNRQFESLARFLNMHVANGVQTQNLQLALVVHGSATLDVLNDDAYKARFGVANANSPLLAALAEQGVSIYQCGQSAAYHKVNNQQLHQDVQMALSAMTAHALLQQQGYSVNPF